MESINRTADVDYSLSTSLWRLFFSSLLVLHFFGTVGGWRDGGREGGVFSVPQHMLSFRCFPVPEQSGGDLHPSVFSPHLLTLSSPAVAVSRPRGMEGWSSDVRLSFMTLTLLWNSPPTHTHTLRLVASACVDQVTSGTCWPTCLRPHLWESNMWDSSPVDQCRGDAGLTWPSG